MTTPTPSKRIAAFDLLRGWFLIVVIIDHVELYPSGYDFVTGRGQLWVSAAEGFFFLSGLLVGMIYRKKADPRAAPGNGMRLVFKKIWSRALLLYCCAVPLTLLYTAWALSTGHAESIKWGAATGLTWDTVWRALRLDYVYGWSDFLSYYVSFMLVAPFIIWALVKRLWPVVVLGSLLLWLNPGDAFTHAWQLIFIGGMMTGFYWKRIQATVEHWPAQVRRTVWRSVVSLAVVTLLVSYANLFVLDDGLYKHLDSLNGGLAHFVTSWNSVNEIVWKWFDKFTLGPGRVVMFALWFTAALLVVQRYAHKLPARVSNVLTLLGQNSLFVYGFHSVFVFIVHAYLPKDWGLAFNFMVTTVVLTIMILLTWGRTAYKQRTAGNVPA